MSFMQQFQQQPSQQFQQPRQSQPTQGPQRIDASGMTFPQFMRMFQGKSIEQAYQECGIDMSQALSILSFLSPGAHGNG